MAGRMRDFTEPATQEAKGEIGSIGGRSTNQVEQLQFENDKLRAEIKDNEKELLSLYRTLSQSCFR